MLPWGGQYLPLVVNFSQQVGKITTPSVRQSDRTQFPVFLGNSSCGLADQPDTTRTMPIGKQPSAKQTAEAAFLEAWERGPLGRVKLEREHRFHPTRKWRFDFAYPVARVAIEIEGRGRHQTVVGYRDDCTKYCWATKLGWRVFRFPATDITLRNEWKESVLENFVEFICEFICVFPEEERDPPVREQVAPVPAVSAPQHRSNSRSLSRKFPRRRVLPR